jgi:hypothetical protein
LLQSDKEYHFGADSLSVKMSRKFSLDVVMVSKVSLCIVNRYLQVTVPV